jgi:ABC-2 type transport system ATP-binding protein
MIEVRDLYKSFNTVRAVNGVSFTIHPHETFGLLGPNGAGKTTTIHMMTGLLQPDSGEIHINGAAAPDRPEVRRAIGVAPQALSLYEDLTGAENLKFFSRLYGLSGQALSQRVRAGLERAELTDRADDLVKTYSGGMKRRLHLACALVHEPQVLFLDEPTVGVDPQARNHLLDDVQRLKQQGRTILLTTHYIEEAERLCDRVAIMDAGRILAMDTVSNIIAQHGGSSLVVAEIDPVDGQALKLPGTLDGNIMTLETDRPFDTMKDLATNGVNVRHLTVERPSLETVFLKLTGRSLRD